MPVKFYMDAHVPVAVPEQLVQRGVDVLWATRERTNDIPDDELLLVATSLKRVLFTFDEGFRVMAEEWQRQGRPFAGLGFAKPHSISIGRIVQDLELIGLVANPEEYENQVFRLPLR